MPRRYSLVHGAGGDGEDDGPDRRGQQVPVDPEGEQDQPADEDYLRRAAWIGRPGLFVGIRIHCAPAFDYWATA
jgi:hypothetical protein